MAGSPVSNPRVTVNLLPAAVVDAFEDRRDVIFGQIPAAGSATSEALITDVHLKTNAELQALFSTGELYWRIKAWQEGAGVFDGGKVPALDVVGIDEAGGATAATATIVASGTATEDGEIVVSVVDGLQFSKAVEITSGDDANTVAAAIEAALDTLTTAPFTAGVSTSTVTVTARDLGPLGNDYGLRVTGTVGGITLTLTGWTGGATAPTLTSILDAIDGRRYTGASWPESWSLTTIAAEFLDRFNVSNNVMDGVVFQGSSDTYANNKTAAQALNNQAVVLIGNSVTDDADDKGPVILQPADWVAAYFMAVRDKRLTTGANIADNVIATAASKDATGGPGLASLPYFNTPLRNTPTTSSVKAYNSTEQIDLEEEGFTVCGTNTAGNAMLMGPVVTTRTTDDAGNANQSFLYLNYVDTASVCREVFFRTLKATYAQYRLTDGDLIEGRQMANKGHIASTLMRVYRTLADAALVQAGGDAEKFFKDNTVIETELATRSVTITGLLPIVTQLGTINYNLALSFTIGQTGTQITF